MFENYDQLNEMHIDLLREIGNIGGSHAAGALADILDERVEISLPLLRITGFNAAIDSLGGAEAQKVGVLSHFSGDVSGMIMFLLNREHASRITDILLAGHQEEQGEEMTPLMLSAIKEIGNILSSSYVGAVAAMADVNIEMSAPSIAIDMVGAIMSVPLIEFGAIGDKIMFIEENFSGLEDHIQSNVILFMEVDSLNLIMAKLGMDP